MTWFEVLKDDEGDDYSYPSTDYKEKSRRKALSAKKRKIREIEHKMRQLENHQFSPSSSINEIKGKKQEYKKLKRKLNSLK